MISHKSHIYTRNFFSDNCDVGVVWSAYGEKKKSNNFPYILHAFVSIRRERRHNNRQRRPHRMKTTIPYFHYEPALERQRNFNSTTPYPIYAKQRKNTLEIIEKPFRGQNKSQKPHNRNVVKTNCRQLNTVFFFLVFFPFLRSFFRSMFVRLLFFPFFGSRESMSMDSNVNWVLINYSNCTSSSIQ